MNKRSCFSKQKSAQLRDRLACHLAKVFADGTIGKYLSVDSGGSELQIIENYQGKLPLCPQIKLAYTIWQGMHVADRHDVLGKFQNSYAGLSITNPEQRKTLVFCALFVHEFATILDEVMEWPE